MDNCIFCNIYAGSIPAKIVLQSNHCFVIEDISPKAPVHMLIIPNVHVNSLFEIPTLNHSLSADIFETASKIANSENLSKFEIFYRKKYFLTKMFIFSKNIFDLLSAHQI